MRPFLSSLPRSPVRNQPCLSTEPMEATDVEERAPLPLPLPLVSASYGPSEIGESALERTQMSPSLPATGLPSTPSTTLPTDVGFLPVRSMATVAASVEW